MPKGSSCHPDAVGVLSVRLVHEKSPREGAGGVWGWLSLNAVVEAYDAAELAALCGPLRSFFAILGSLERAMAMPAESDVYAFVPNLFAVRDDFHRCSTP